MDSDDRISGTGLYQTYKRELEAWGPVNRQLKQHGLRHVILADPNQMLNNDNVIGFSQVDSESLRDNLVVLMKDGDRRQTLIQDLIMTNNQLRSDLETKGPMNTEAVLLADELRNQLSSANSKIAELEISLEQVKERNAENHERDTNTKVAAQTRARQLEKRCELQEEELERLRNKIRLLNEEQYKREKRVQDIFTELRRGANRGLSTTDKRLLDVIDMYEIEISKLKRKVDRLQANRNNDSTVDSDDDVDIETSARYKDLIKHFNNDLKHSEKEVKKLKEKNDLLELELQARPHVDDYNRCRQKIRQLERLLQEHNVGIYAKDAFNKKSYSTKREDVDFLPLNHCRNYLNILCDELDLDDLNNLQLSLELYKTYTEGYPKLESLLTQIADVVEPSIIKSSKNNKHKMWCNKHWKSVVSRLETWRQNMKQLPELCHLAIRLLQQFEKPKDSLSTSANVSEIIQALEGIVTDVPPAPSQPVANETVSHPVLLSIVKHFQHLFDVPTISGVYPRMNELFTRISEMKTVLRTLADLLDLGTNYKGSDIVDAVGRVCQSYTSSTYVQLKHLLQEDELDSVIERLDEHRKFMPLFRDILDNLMEILDVQRIDQVVPSVRALKLMIS